MRPSIRSDVSVNEWRGKDFETFLRLTASQAKISVVPEKLRTLDHGRPWSDDQFASTRLSSNRDMSR